MNIGLAVLVLIFVLPVGFLQLEVAFTESYAAARSQEFYTMDLIQTAYWLRIPGDVMIILGSIVFAWDVFAKLRHREPAAVVEHQRDQPIVRRVLEEEDYLP